MTPGFATLLLSALNGARPRVPIVCVQLHDGPPGVGSSNLSGITGRQEISLTAPDSGAIALTGVAPSWEVTDSETIAAVSLWSGFDGDPDAMCLFTLAADPPVPVADGDVLVLNTCGLQWAPAVQGLWAPGTNVAAPTAAAAASMLVPSLRIGQSLTVPVMGGEATMLTPELFEGVVAEPPPMQAHAGMLTPTLAADATLAAPTAEASASMLTPTVVTSVSANVDAPTMHAASLMLPPSVGGSAVIPVMTAQASARGLPPTISASSLVTSPLMRAAATPLTPSVLVTTPVSYSTIGTGNAPGAHTSSLSWTHTAAAGDDVFALVNIRSAGAYPAINSFTYGGVAMTQLAMVYSGSSSAGGWLALYHLANAPGTNQTVSVSLSASQYANGNSVSFKNVGSIGTPSTTTATSQTLTGVPNGILLQAFGDIGSLSSLAGGTVLYNQTAAGYADLVIQDSSATGAVTFTAKSSTGYTAGIGVVLNPG